MKKTLSILSLSLLVPGVAYGQDADSLQHVFSRDNAFTELTKEEESIDSINKFSETDDSLFVLGAEGEDLTSTEPIDAGNERDSLGIAFYGLRLGVDIFSTLEPLWNKNVRNSFAIVADYRLSQKLYLAGAFGMAANDFTFPGQNSLTKGWYGKLGVNYSVVNGIVADGDMMYFGAKLLYSNYLQTISGSFAKSDYWHPEQLPLYIESRAYTLGLEISMGVEVNVFKNIFMGIRGAYNLVLGNKKITHDFKPLAAPGFGQIYNGGSSFNASYTISYMIPFSGKTYYKKAKKNREETQRQKQEEKIFEPAYKGTKILDE